MQSIKGIIDQVLAKDRHRYQVGSHSTLYVHQFAFKFVFEYRSQLIDFVADLFSEGEDARRVIKP